MSDLAPMDIFSRYMDVPFSLAAYCRGHRYSVEAVQLAKAIQARAVADTAADAAQIMQDSARERLILAISAVQSKMERDPL